MWELLLRIARWIVSREGGVVIPSSDFDHIVNEVHKLRHYMLRSGHINRVAGGTPKAVITIDRGLTSILLAMGGSRLLEAKSTELATGDTVHVRARGYGTLEGRLAKGGGVG